MSNGTKRVVVASSKAEFWLICHACLHYLVTVTRCVQVPDDIVFLEEIPHNATGKVSKLTLRQMFKDHKPAQSKL